MADGSGQQEAHYSAFISYSHRDAAFARRLHRRLETYRLPRRRGRQTNWQGGFRRLRPIFLDREEFSAEPDLTEAVRAAILQSSHLIVVCSPAAVVSEWVDIEIRLFRDLHGEHGILAAVFQGEPAAVIPPAMTEGRTLGGPQTHPPLAADFRREGDGDQLALLKLVAPLAGVGLDDLVHRDAQRRVRRMSAIGAGALVGVGVAGALTLVAIQGRIAAEREQARSQGMVNYLLTDVHGKLKGVGRLDILDAVNKGVLRYCNIKNIVKQPSAIQIACAKSDQADGDSAEKRGDYADARKDFDDASNITNSLYRSHPADPAVIYAQAQSAYWNGFMCWRTGDDAGALADFKAYAELAKKLPPIPHHNPDYQLEPANAESDLGIFVLRQSIDVRDARRHFEDAQRIYDVAGRERPDDHDVQIAIADGRAWLADTDRLGGNFTDALAERMRQRATLHNLLARDPRDFEAQSALVGNDLAVARISASRGHLTEAIGKLKIAHREATRLAFDDPDNKAVAKEARVIELFEARVWLAMPPRQRPPDRTIRNAVGDCAQEALKPRNAELAAFCEIVDAQRTRWSKSEPRSPRVENAIARLRGDGDYKLTQRWLMDLEDETSF